MSKEKLLKFQQRYNKNRICLEKIEDSCNKNQGCVRKNFWKIEHKYNKNQTCLEKIENWCDKNQVCLEKNEESYKKLRLIRKKIKEL